MKKIFTLLCAAVIAVSTMNAEVLFNEHFAQTTETLATNTDALPYSGEIAETGWTNVWGSGDMYVNKTTDLTYAGYKSNSDGTGSAEYKVTFAKRVASPFSKSVNSGSVYMAGIVKISSMKSSGKDYLWALGVGTSGLNAASSKQYARPYVYQSGTGFKFGIAKLDETSTATYIDYTETEYEYGTYLLVVEYTWKEGDKNDEIKLYVNPTKGDKPASATCMPKAAQAEKKVDAESFGSVVLFSSNTSQAACLIDELKVVTDWSDLWEAGEAPQTPTIIADQSFSFGNVNVNEAANKNLTIKGSNLKGAISIASNNEQLVVSAASVTKEAAESAEGASVGLTLTATTAGEGSAKITLSSEDAADKVINVTWNAVEPLPSVTNIAAIASLAEGKPYVLATQPIVIGSIDGVWVLQDATGAFIYNEYGMCELAIGDKLEKVVILRVEEEEYTRGFVTAYAYDFPTVVSHENALVPIETNIADMTNYGPAYIKLTQVEFTDTNKDKFAQGWFNIKQGDNTARIQVPENCDIIGEDIPAKADVVGQLVYTTGGIAISSSTNLTNRVSRSATAIENIQSKGKAVKVVRNGQLIILRDGKEYNVLGVEK